MESQIENFGRADGQPLVSIIVLNCNGAGWLPKCFETIKAQTILGQIEAIMVDNNSTDDSVAVARRLLADFPCARTVRNSANLGFCEGNNSGARAANGRYLFFLNNDTWMETDCICLLYTSLCHNWPFLLLKTKNTMLNGKFYPENTPAFWRPPAASGH